MRRAAAHHGAGDLAAAGEIYRRVIEADPGNAEALHAAAVIAHQVDQHQAAIDLARLAIGIGPRANYLKGCGLRASAFVLRGAQPSGGATSCETLWMGVPVVTLAGNTFVGRAGVSLLNASGLGELVATDTGDYAAIAARLAFDVPRLAALRAGLRERLRDSPLCRADDFTRALERHIRDMWGRWCAETP